MIGFRQFVWCNHHGWLHGCIQTSIFLQWSHPQHINADSELSFQYFLIPLLGLVESPWHKIFLFCCCVDQMLGQLREASSGDSQSHSRMAWQTNSKHFSGVSFWNCSVTSLDLVNVTLDCTFVMRHECCLKPEVPVLWLLNGKLCSYLSHRTKVFSFWCITKIQSIFL